MKYVLMMAFAAAVLVACQKPQPKQWYAEAPEIDMVKAADAAFTNADFDAFRPNWADTAKIWFNTMDGGGISADSLTALLKNARAGYATLKMTNPIYEMIVTDKGDKWVHRWGQWEATNAAGASIKWASNANFLVSDGKIRMGAYVLNQLPMHLVNEAAAAAAAADAKK